MRCGTYSGRQTFLACGSTWRGWSDSPDAAILQQRLPLLLATWFKINEYIYLRNISKSCTRRRASSPSPFSNSSAMLFSFRPVLFTRLDFYLGKISGENLRLTFVSQAPFYQAVVICGRNARITSKVISRNVSVVCYYGFDGLNFYFAAILWRIRDDKRHTANDVWRMTFFVHQTPWLSVSLECSA